MSNAHHHARGEWVTKEGRVIPVAEMETSHLVNVAKLYARNTACFCADEYMDVDDEDFTAYLTGEPFWPHLSAELDKRHIDVVKLVNDHLAANGYDYRLTREAMQRFISEYDDNYGLTWPDNL
jgi:hypothetical protein